MPTPITVSIPHQLGRAEARRRIDAGFGKLTRQLPGVASCDHQWSGDQLDFSAAGMGQAICGTVEVAESSVTIRIELPGVLGMIAGRLKEQLQKSGQLLLGRN